jgi:hypothetical protein
LPSSSHKIVVIFTSYVNTKQIYNPKNIPIGWDGKPIPYWLYKIHGLGVEYKCEICGGASYWGRKAFEHHFQEGRHTYGMKCLKLPNTLQFKEITSIEDALKLQKKLLEDEKKKEFRADIEEEFEDENGNIVKQASVWSHYYLYNMPETVSAEIADLAPGTYTVEIVARGFWRTESENTLKSELELK